MVEYLKSIVSGLFKTLITRHESKALLNQTWNKYWIYYAPLWLTSVIIFILPVHPTPGIFSHVVFFLIRNPLIQIGIALVPYWKEKVPYSHLQLIGFPGLFIFLIVEFFVAKYLHIYYGLFNDKFVN